MIRLPVDELKDELFSAVDAGSRDFVVSAPTGSGKSTRLPVMLAEKLGGRILVLQPRRVAARMLAKSVSTLCGANAGWHVRFDKHYDESTEIVFLTEGILARMVLSDPSLRGVKAVVFDEFHERNIYADLSLALVLKARKDLNSDLVVAVCSASMDSDSLLGYLGDGAVKLECGTRLYPIDIEYAPPKDRTSFIWECAAREFDRLAREESEGNFLVFMPGIYEISKTASRIAELPSARGFDVFALHGDLEPQVQDRILSDSGRRKVIVSTNVAETSLTIEGVRFVIDSGFARVARFDPARGVNTLLSERVSLASAAQRAGRAGRTSAGRAVRLWRQSDEVSLERFNTPEIARLDLSQVLLWLKASGLDFRSLRLFESPSEASLERANATLRALGALSADGSITRTGLEMASFPTEPRYARLLIEGARRGCLSTAAMIAALYDAGRVKLRLDDAFAEAERDALVGDVYSEPEEVAKLCLIARENGFKDFFCRRLGIHAANARKVCATAADLERIARRLLRVSSDTETGEAVADSVLAAFSEHLGVRLNQGTLACRLAGGKRGEIARDSRNYASDIFVALDLQERNVAGGVSILASMISPVRKERLAQMFPESFSETVSTELDSRNKRVIAKTRVMFGELPISESDSGTVPPAAAANLLRDEILSGRLELKNFDDDAREFIDRVNFVSAACPETGIQPIDDDAKAEIFGQMCCGCTSFSEVRNMDVHAALRDWLSYEQLELLKYLAPASVEMPRRKRPVKIRYESSPPRAVVASFFKDFYDFDSQKLRICDGKIRPTYEILSPGGRIAQTTQNLDEFWQTSWIAVKKELKARYPKHFKPDDPH